MRIVCRDESWTVHRIVMSGKSSVFKRLIDELPGASHPSQNRPETMLTLKKDANPGVIDLTGYDPNIVDKMLRFIYQGIYDDERETAPRFDPTTYLSPGQSRLNGEALIVNIKLYNLAEKFGLHELMEVAVLQYTSIVRELWDTPSFERSIKMLYGPKADEAQGRGLRNATASVIAHNVGELMDSKPFRAVLNLYGELATEVLSMVVSGQRAR